MRNRILLPVMVMIPRLEALPLVCAERLCLSGLLVVGKAQPCETQPCGKAALRTNERQSRKAVKLTHYQTDALPRSRGRFESYTPRHMARKGKR